MSTSSNPQVALEKHFSSSILLWMRTDQPRQKGMDHCAGRRARPAGTTS